MNIEPVFARQFTDSSGFEPAANDLAFIVLEENAGDGISLLIELRDERAFAGAYADGDNGHPCFAGAEANSFQLLSTFEGFAI